MHDKKNVPLPDIVNRIPELDDGEKLGDELLMLGLEYDGIPPQKAETIAVNNRLVHNAHIVQKVPDQTAYGQEYWRILAEQTEDPKKRKEYLKKAMGRGWSRKR